MASHLLYIYVYKTILSHFYPKTPNQSLFFLSLKLKDRRQTFSSDKSGKTQFSDICWKTSYT